MVAGHAHPKIVEAVQKQAALGTHFAQPTKGLDAVGENLVDRFGLPLWRFCNSGTEATLEAARLMRATTGRNMIIKIEGTLPRPPRRADVLRRPRPRRRSARASTPSRVPQALGIPQAFADLVRVVPFNDLAEAERALEENEGDVAGMIVEPAMMNCGVILPEPGYLQGLKDLLHKHGAYLAFDEVKTGATIAYGGAVEAFGVCPTSCASRRRSAAACRAARSAPPRSSTGRSSRGEYDMAGTFNGNPLTMAASKATLTEVLTKDVYDQLNRVHKVLAEGAPRRSRSTASRRT